MTDAEASGQGRGDSVDLASVTPHGDCGREFHTTTTEHITAMLGSLRLLEAAGACELIATTAIDSYYPTRPAGWWKAVADAARTYRSAIHDASVRGFCAIDEWSLSGAAEDSELRRERARLRAEHREWLCDVPGGAAYVAWLSAYLATVELDGQRALTRLERCTAIAREFTEVPEPAPEASAYEILQGAADSLVRFLPLGEHPLSDMHRFAFLPAPLRTG